MVKTLGFQELRTIVGKFFSIKGQRAFQALQAIGYLFNYSTLL